MMAQFAELQSRTVGDFKITFIADGGGLIEPTAMYPASAKKGWGDYAHLLDDQGRLVVTIGGFLIETGDQNILLDLGFGPMTVDFPGFGPFIGGKFMESFAQTGLTADQITQVVYSHLHLDHVGWTSQEVDGKQVLSFPNARYLCTQAEWDFWQADETGMGPNQITVVDPIKDVIEFITARDELAPGVTVLSTPGHTPGHISLRLDAGDQVVYLIVDLLHSEAQFKEADWSVAFDIDPVQGRTTREGIYAELAQPNVLVADGHFSNSVFGRLSHENGQWIWQAE
ncbi:MAG: MBL fold metallo-hydrolase [Chloroflexota bacterium]